MFLLPCIDDVQKKLHALIQNHISFLNILHETLGNNPGDTQLCLFVCVFVFLLVCLFVYFYLYLIYLFFGGCVPRGIKKVKLSR